MQLQRQRRPPYKKETWRADPVPPGKTRLILRNTPSPPPPPSGHPLPAFPAPVEDPLRQGDRGELIIDNFPKFPVLG